MYLILDIFHYTIVLFIINIILYRRIGKFTQPLSNKGINSYQITGAKLPSMSVSTSFSKCSSDIFDKIFISEILPK